MCNGIYIKANGELPCWCDVGEKLILRTLNETKLANGEERDLFSFPELQHIRNSFLSGTIPYPEYCPRCAVYGHGVATSATPTTIQVLHVEPSFFCNLACPQCLPPKRRREFATPPYNMSPEFYHNVLRQLKQEGILAIRFIHFEGRGDPMMNNKLGQMLAITRKFYPTAFTTVTTNGNFPYRPWMLDGHLNSLRISADGVTQEAYAQYRKGGKLETVIALIRDIRNHEPAVNRSLSIAWKYILFEWNDSDEEIRAMGQLAKELKVNLQFCLTHSPGKSLRFIDSKTLNTALRTLAPNAVPEMTFQLKSNASIPIRINSTIHTIHNQSQKFLRLLGGLIPKSAKPTAPSPLAGEGRDGGEVTLNTNDEDIGAVIAQQVEALLLRVLEQCNAGKISESTHLINQALALDPGFNSDALFSGTDPVKDNIEMLIANIHYPSTASLLANIQVAKADFYNAGRLFAKYLELAPNAEDATTIQAAIIKYRAQALYSEALAAYRSGNSQVGGELLNTALSYDPGLSKEQLQQSQDTVQENISLLIDTIHYPGTASLLANIQMARGDFLSATQLFKRYLELAPQAVDAPAIQNLLNKYAKQQ